MCENPSPAQNNRPVPGAPSEFIPHAGFASAQPEGVEASPAQLGPTLLGWPRSIAWSEFRDIENRPSGERENALISVSLRPGRVRVAEENAEYRLGEMEFNILVVRSESWVVESEKTGELLIHEQGHYDIAGLCYRDMVAEARRLRGSSRNGLIRQVQRVMREHDQRADGLSDQYDVDSDHGRNQTHQQAWLNQITASRESGEPLVAPSGLTESE